MIDAVSQFVVLRTSDQTLTFLHNLIPAWLTDKNKSSRKLFIDKKIAECPHLLHSCIRNTSNAVRETVLIPHVSAPWLEWNVYAFPDPEIGNMHCFATSSDKKTVAGAEGRSLLFFDASTAETVHGPFEISRDTIDKIDQLEFSPDGKFVFFGRLDKWFSVERGCVEDFSQFSGNSHIYKWGVFIRDGNCIVVKRNWSYNPNTCQSGSCLVNLLALWAVKEIEQSRDDEMTVCFNRQQVWDLQSGMPVLHHVFSQSVQLNPFSYLCHVTRNFNLRGLKLQCDDIDKALSVCNVAVINAVCCGLFGPSFSLECELELKWKPVQQQVLNWVRVWLRVRAQKRKMTSMKKQELKQELKRDLKRDLKWQLVQKLMRELEWKMDELEEKDVERMVEEELKVDVLVSPELIKKFDKEAFEFEVCINIPKGFQDLVNKINGDILICMSPQRKWILEADSFLKMCVLSRGDQEKHSCNYGKPEHKISEVVRFTFTNDDLYFVYSSEDSLHALSLQTGTIFTSVSGCNVFYFTRERQVGYLFRSGTEEIAILLSNLFSPFTFFKVSPVKPSVVRKSIAAVFCSSDTVISVSSDSMVTLWKTTEDQGISFISQSSLTMAGQQESNVKNCVFSTDGKLMAIHQGQGIGYPHFYVWDVQEKVMSASFKSPRLFTVECCCLSLNERELILCGEYQIEIWEYDEHPCRLLTRLDVERPYDSVTFSQCTVSLDNQLLVCCIANRILVYSLHDPDVNSSKRVLRGHLGRIDFCRFLKVNRYLISYGVDGLVFLWDISESKVAGFARIAQVQESIVSMAVSPEEDKVVCFTSSGRVCVIKLCELGCSLSLKPLMAPAKCKMETAETSLQVAEQIASTSQIPTSSSEDDSDGDDSDEDMYEYYLEHDILDESD
ncbi:hypothetical protein OS493_037540 [Desmophyllum pertusum]|uniref:Uncharacterized protein n=1 Tax=Desmophyllum pertusum TaxID=174260 RepID=A0A9X0CVN3_9CNID|nr:hypothetical protein OS493_037540 [Desmophyllum pertusum]